MDMNQFKGGLRERGTSMLDGPYITKLSSHTLALKSNSKSQWDIITFEMTACQGGNVLQSI